MSRTLFVWGHGARSVGWHVPFDVYVCAWCGRRKRTTASGMPVFMGVGEELRLCCATCHLKRVAEARPDEYSGDKTTTQER